MALEQKEHAFSGRYLGGFRRTLDESRRVLIPSEWRNADPASEYFLLPRPFYLPQFILVFPPQRYNLVITRLNGSATTEEEESQIERAIADFAAVVKPDSGGRIVIPMEMLNKLGIKKDVWLAGRITMFEIWNPEVYLKIREKQAIEAERIIKDKGIKL